MHKLTFLYMDERLSKLISDYQSRVAEAVTMLERAGIPRPYSNVQWACNDVPRRGRLCGEFNYYKHGFGCEVYGPEWRIDFDFGWHGEIDGFGVGSLYYFASYFASTRLSEYGFTCEDEIKAALQVAWELGDLTVCSNGHYSFKRAPDHFNLSLCGRD
jgi:hypothetical protein